MHELSLRVNGESRRLLVDAEETLLDTLRDRLHFTGTTRGGDLAGRGAAAVRTRAMWGSEPLGVASAVTSPPASQ